MCFSFFISSSDFPITVYKMVDKDSQSGTKQFKWFEGWWSLVTLHWNEFDVPWINLWDTQELATGTWHNHHRLTLYIKINNPDVFLQKVDDDQKFKCCPFVIECTALFSFKSMVWCHRQTSVHVMAPLVQTVSVYASDVLDTSTQRWLDAWWNAFLHKHLWLIEWVAIVNSNRGV